MDSPHRLIVTDLCRRFDWREIFGNDHPVELDLGAGDGGFAIAYARQHPEINLLAVERLLGRVRKIEKRAARNELSNVSACCGWSSATPCGTCCRPGAFPSRTSCFLILGPSVGIGIAASCRPISCAIWRRR